MKKIESYDLHGPDKRLHSAELAPQLSCPLKQLLTTRTNKLDVTDLRKINTLR
jgi:hypothetical protein